MDLEAVLASLSIFEPLRPDEIGRIARRFTRERLAAGAVYASDAARLVVIVRGSVDLTVDQGDRTLRARMSTGDRFGTYALLTGYVHPYAVTAHVPSTIAVLDQASFDQLLVEFPVIALPLSREVAAELAARDDFLRQLLELQASKLPEAELAAAVERRRLAQEKRAVRVTRSTTRGLFRRLVVSEGAEPPFWMLVGFLTSLCGARLVVHLILKFGLEKRLFALVPGRDPNPMHIHHFNYGLFLVGIAGLLALAPLGRRRLRGLAFVFGFGAGLVFDEFALFWNLNPEYAQDLSLIAAGIAAAVLIQLIYFRRFWAAVFRRAWLELRGTR